MKKVFEFKLFRGDLFVEVSIEENVTITTWIGSNYKELEVISKSKEEIVEFLRKEDAKHTTETIAEGDYFKRFLNGYICQCIYRWKTADKLIDAAKQVEDRVTEEIIAFIEESIEIKDDKGINKIEEIKEEYINHMEDWKEETLERVSQKDWDYVIDLISEAETIEDFESVDRYLNEPTMFDMDTPNVDLETLKRKGGEIDEILF